MGESIAIIKTLFITTTLVLSILFAPSGIAPSEESASKLETAPEGAATTMAGNISIVFCN